MKKLMFSVAGLSVAVLVGGCASTGQFKSADGRALTTATGAPIVVSKEPKQAKPIVVDDNATYADRIKAAKQRKAQEVEISVDSAKVAQSLAKDVEKDVINRLKAVLPEGYSGLVTIIVFVDGRPMVKDDILRQSALKYGKKIDAGTIIALRALIEDPIQKFLEESVYPAIVKATMERIRPYVMDMINKGNFAKAREIIWTASTRGVPGIDNPVREECMKLMHGLVNPSDWKKLEKDIEAVFQKAMEAKAYDEGIANLKKLGDESIVREYSVIIDKKIEAVKAELVKIGVKEEDMAPILEKQYAIIAAAARITDIHDKIVTLEDAKKEVRQVEARKDPALKDYYEKLDAFHDTLIKYDCTEDNADRIADKLDKDLLALVEMLRRPAKFEADESGAKTALELGTRSLNERIRTMVADRIDKLIQARDAKLRAAYLAKLAAAKSDLEEKVRALVAEGKFEEARELIWNASITGDVEWDADMFALGVALLRDLVNPADWARIEKEIVGTFDRLSQKGDFDALQEYLEKYPLIRQHTVKLDDQLAKVKAEAEALGANPESAAKAAAVACGMVTEAEALVDHLDRLVSDAAGSGQEVNKDRLQKELEVYAAKLAAYHATPENVATIVAKLRLELEKLIVAPTNPETTHLALGTNAVNDRIKKLTAKLLAIIEETKYKWQSQELLRVMADLEKRVRAAVKEGRFDDARNYIRDEKLIGRQDVDLKLYELRVGLLDSCVNPAQLEYLLGEIAKKVAALKEADDYVGLLAYIANPPQVHDEYEAIDSALAAVKNAMLALEISEAEAVKDEKVTFFKSIQELLEKRRESWKPERDLSAVEKALSEVAKAMFDHLNKHPELIATEQNAEYAHILADIAALDHTITTWELNARLRARLAAELADAQHGRNMQLYKELLAKIDGDVSIDTQIMLAEEAISRQLGVACDKASFKINAVLGEYARAFRILKQGGKLSATEATSMLLGGAYLDQAAVAKYALELGAKVDGTSARDPRKRTALMLAIDTQHLTLIKSILEAGASSTAADAEGNSVMHYAVKAGSVAVVKALAKTAPMDVVNEAGETPLYAAVRRNQAALVEAVTGLVANGDRAEFVNRKDKSGLTAFALAAKTGARDVLDALAAAGATYSEKDLILAEAGDHVAIAQWLVAKGADVNAEGVMAAACPATATGRYLVHEGGVGEHACATCKPKASAVEAPAAPEPAKVVEAEGDITFKIKNVK